jgi:ADP-L-glycero-D-manno-heptose 6-epimerase
VIDTTDRPVLVTGSSGFIGGAVAAQLRASGHVVVTLDRSGAADRAMDAADPRLLADIRQGVYGAVVHQAGISNTLERNERLLIEHNTTKPLALADASVAAAIPFIYASSFSVYGATGRRAVREADVGRTSGPLNPYAISKLRLDTEMAARHAGADWLGLRYTNVFGPNEPIDGRAPSVISRWLRSSARAEPLEIFAGTRASGRDFVPVDRVATVIARRLADAGAAAPRGIFNLGSGVTITFGELIDWCREFSGGSLSVRDIPFAIEDQYQHWTAADMSALSAHYPDLGWGDYQLLKAYANACWRSFGT